MLYVLKCVCFASISNPTFIYCRWLCALLLLGMTIRIHHSEIHIYQNMTSLVDGNNAPVFLQKVVQRSSILLFSSLLENSICSFVAENLSHSHILWSRSPESRVQNFPKSNFLWSLTSTCHSHDVITLYEVIKLCYCDCGARCRCRESLL